MELAVGDPSLDGHLGLAHARLGKGGEQGAQRMKSECAQSTTAARPTRVPEGMASSASMMAFVSGSLRRGTKASGP